MIPTRCIFIVAAALLLLSCESSPPGGQPAAFDERSATATAQSDQAGALDEAMTTALLEALDDERHALALYEAVMQRFGEVRPFANIAQGERRHIEMLLPLFAKYGVQVPEDRWADHEFDVPAMLREACAASVEAEEANIAMYDGFLLFVKEPDVRKVFQYLRAASAENHLPAFRRCARRR